MIQDRAIKIAERQGLCSASSNTKWKRLIPLIQAFPCHKRIKFIDADEPTRWQVGLWQPAPNYVEASCGPEQLKFVEYVEIERFERRHVGRLVSCGAVDHSDAIRQTLEEARATFTETESSIIVFGYTRPTSQPSVTTSLDPTNQEQT